MDNRLTRWWHANAPTRESLEKSRVLAPVAHRVLEPSLWRFTRRSVPRGVALGLFVGIFLMIPGVQIAGAALLALPFRANIPVAAAMTFLSNPATTPLILGSGAFLQCALRPELTWSSLHRVKIDAVLPVSFSIQILN